MEPGGGGVVGVSLKGMQQRMKPWVECMRMVIALRASRRVIKWYGITGPGIALGGKGDHVLPQREFWMLRREKISSTWVSIEGVPETGGGVVDPDLWAWRMASPPSIWESAQSLFPRRNSMQTKRMQHISAVVGDGNSAHRRRLRNLMDLLYWVRAKRDWEFPACSLVGS